MPKIKKKTSWRPGELFFSVWLTAISALSSIFDFAIVKYNSGSPLDICATGCKSRSALFENLEKWE